METRQFRFSEISSAPYAPGVYAWYYRTELTDKDIAQCIKDVEQESSESAQDDIMRLFLETHLFRYYKETPYSVAISGKLKPKYEGVVQHRSEASASLVRRLSSAPEKLYEFKKALKLAVPLFASPIYIGVAKQLRGRLMGHVRLIDQLRNLRATLVDDITTPSNGDITEEERDHKFAHEVSLIRGFTPSSLIVNTLELPIDESIRYELENVFNRINYPLCGRN